MKKRLIGSIIMLLSMWAASVMVNFLLEPFEREVAELKSELVETNKLLDESNKLLDEAMTEGRRLYNENEILKQELSNVKALLEKEEEKRNVYSRGSFQYEYYNEYSRVDVPSDISAEKLDKAFAGTDMEGLGMAFAEAEDLYEINAIFLAAIAALESGWGSSDFSINRNNLFGFGSYDYDTNQTIYFNSKTEGILYVAEYVKESYLTESGTYYNGATPAGVEVRYSSSRTWDSKVVSIMNLIVEKATK